MMAHSGAVHDGVRNRMVLLNVLAGAGCQYVAANALHGELERACKILDTRLSTPTNEDLGAATLVRYLGAEELPVSTDLLTITALEGLVYVSR